MFYLFGLLFFFTPLILWPYTSEIFEFNKMLFVYLNTAAILVFWIIKCIKEKKIIFKKTILNIPILFYLATSLLSTIFSLDPTTSFFGYYSRFNGGLLSLICYSLLYFAFVSNIKEKQAKKIIALTLCSAVIVSIYGVLQHFGIDKHIWKQDVQNRVFSTLGQPNWLASYITLLLPITWIYVINKQKALWLYILNFLLFTTLVFTKSRSGLLGFVGTSIVFWLYFFWKTKFMYIKQFLILNLGFILLFVIFFSPLKPAQDKNVATQNQEIVNPILEVGGTDSGEIRKIVWKGALNIWKSYPLFGSGLETFAYSYATYKPKEHNLTSEWNYIYNKAHNEYLNHLANSGILGLISYLLFLYFVIQQIYKNADERLNVGILSGIISLLISNFFGFSVVVTNLFLFLLPAFSLSLKEKSETIKKQNKLNSNQKFAIFLLSLGFILFSYQISRYWLSDHYYFLARENNKRNNLDNAFGYIQKAINIFPNQGLFRSESADIYTKLKNPQKSVDEANLAVKLSPYNMNFRRMLFSVYIRNSNETNDYALMALKTIYQAFLMVPNDAMVAYTLGLTYSRMGLDEEGLNYINLALNLRPKYKEARLAKAYALINLKREAEAKAELKYILDFVDPNDDLIKAKYDDLN